MAPARVHATAPDADSIGSDTGSAQASGKWLVFALGATEYAVDVGCVQQIIGLLPITRVPRMPESVRGVINLRGRVIPVVDLRIRFGLDAVDHGDRTCIIVVDAGAAGYGIVVDRVMEVVQLDDGSIGEAPQFAGGVDTDHLLGVAKHADQVLLLLDVGRALSSETTAALHGATSETAGSAGQPQV